MVEEVGISRVKVAELLPEKFHDQVSQESLKIEVPLSAFPQVRVEVSDKIHLFNSEKSEELIFDPYPEENVILQHKTYMNGPGTYSGGFIEYYKDGSVSYGQFSMD